MTRSNGTETAIHVSGMIDALSKGFSEYLRSSTRVAALYATNMDGPIFVYDPRRLLSEHRDALKQYLSTATAWRSEPITFAGGQVIDAPVLDRLLCSAFRGRIVPFQLWIAELPEPDPHADVIRSWLSQAILAWELETNDSDNFMHTQSTRLMLEAGARGAVEAAIQRLYRKQSETTLAMRVDRIIDLLIVLSRSFEEKKQHNGRIAFQEKVQDLSVRLAEPISLGDQKHIGKLLTVTGSGVWLIADDKFAYGYSAEVPDHDLLATLIGGLCGLHVKDAGVGQIDRGSFQATEYIPDLDKIKDMLGGTNELHMSVQDIILNARKGSHGASIIVDVTQPTMALGGNVLNPQLSHYESHFVLGRMSKVDGAIHLDANGSVIAFGCILDGIRDSEREKSSRGSRFNSAIRFTRQNPSSLAIVVSEDGPVSFIKDGIDLLEKPAVPEMDKIELNPPEFDAWYRQNQT